MSCSTSHRTIQFQPHSSLDFPSLIRFLKFHQLAKAGVTTALDMGLLPGPVRDRLHSYTGIAELRFAGNFATSTGSTHSRFKHCTPASLVDTPESAVRFVEDRIAEGVDYIKIVCDVPGPSQ
jgi:hypothetical protein